MTDKIRLLIVDDEEMFRKLLLERFSKQEFETTGCASAEEALDVITKKEFDVGIFDMRMPGMDGIDLFKTIRKSHPHFETIILTGAASVDTAIEALKHGAYDYLTKPCKLFELELIVHKAYEKKMLSFENTRLRNSITAENRNYKIIGDSEKTQELKKLAERVASSRAPILITGESGVGKEYLARCIHQMGKSKDSPFISVSCGSQPHGILENQLFGHEKDAFADAVSAKTGWLQLAEGGTIFLNDIEEIHQSTQVKLNHYLETGAFQMVGGHSDIRSNVRIIAATENVLRDMVLKKNFREDLYYKLSVITIEVPPLRDRKEDIPSIIEMSLQHKQDMGNGKKFSNKAINAMLKYDWPGNIRELIAVVERATMVASKRTIQAKDIPLSIENKTKKNKLRHLLSLSDIEKEHILYVLNATGGNISRAARILGISRPKLYRKIEQYKAGV
ncbi:MAG: sigma-54 dependent transcriptional regulator [Nitrospinota bacterium]|nr:sigma-54 dependent transcriptional regulator [Nitrospinota bacterium]